MISVTKALRTTLSSIAVAAMLILGLAPSANAAFKIRFDDTATVAIDRTYTDTDLDGIVSIPAPPPFTSAGSFTLTNGIGLSKPDMGTASSPSMDLQAGVRRANGTRTLKVYLTDTGFTGIGKALMAIGGTSMNSSITYETYWDPGNGEFALTNLIGANSFGPTLGLYDFSASKAGGFIGNITGYSLTQVVTITYNAVAGAPSSLRNLTTFNAALNVDVPEPATLGLFGLGLFGALAVARRRRVMSAE